MDKNKQVETVVLLSREKVNGYVDIDLDVEQLVLRNERITTSDPEKAKS